LSYALLALAGNIVCWRLGDWKDWKRFYPTILYAYMGNLVYDVLCYRRLLWAFGGVIRDYPVLDLAVMVLLYPAAVMLFLSHYPGPRFRQFLYMLMWTGIFAAVELAAYFTGGFAYYNGWTFWHSVVFNLIMFPLIRLHFRRPLLVWPISAALALLVVWWFRVPLVR
jgi:hypothetical protein